jgi:hypothetical protein
MIQPLICGLASQGPLDFLGCHDPVDRPRLERKWTQLSCDAERELPTGIHRRAPRTWPGVTEVHTGVASDRAYFGGDGPHN